MAHVLADRVMETSTTTGTDAFTLAGAYTGYRRFSAVLSTNDTCRYCIAGVDGNGNDTGEWEVGLGTYSATNTLTRTTVESSSNANAAVNFSAGNKRVLMGASATFMNALLQASKNLSDLGSASTARDNLGLKALATADYVTESLVVGCSDESTALVAATGLTTFRMPYAFTVTEVRASLTTAQTSGSIFTVDINEGGTSILSTKLTIDNTEKTSTTAATAAVISDASLANDAEMSVDIDQIGDGTAKGLKITLIGHQ